MRQSCTVSEAGLTLTEHQFSDPAGSACCMLRSQTCPTMPGLEPPSVLKLPSCGLEPFPVLSFRNLPTAHFTRLPQPGPAWLMCPEPVSCSVLWCVSGPPSCTGYAPLCCRPCLCLFVCFRPHNCFSKTQVDLPAPHSNLSGLFSHTRPQVLPDCPLFPFTFYPSHTKHFPNRPSCHVPL